MDPQTLSEEACFYNALIIETRAPYARLATLYENFGSWKEIWKNHRTPSFIACSPEEEWEKLMKATVALVVQGDPSYPSLLREIPNPPLGLYYRGTLPPKEMPALAIVGTRKATHEGKKIARDLACALAKKQWVVVSGLALGIDAAGHSGALEGGGRTLAVLAHGLHDVHPTMHTALAHEILEGGGALLSEYPLGMPALKNHFVARNRLISGLARGVLIIEAPSRSGALRTAHFASEQNRDVLVVPGPASHPNFQGSHELIRNGAGLVANRQHLFEELGLETVQTTLRKEEKRMGEEYPGSNAVRSLLHAAHAALTIDKISEATNLNVQNVSQIITVLLLDEIIEETPNGITIKHRS